MKFFYNYQQNVAKKIGDNVINIEEKKQTDQTKKEQSPKVENKHKVVRENVHNPVLKSNQKVASQKPADKDKTKSARKAKQAKVTEKQVNDNVPAPAAQQDKATIEVTGQPVKMSYANIVKKEVSNLPVEKPKAKPKVSYILVSNCCLNFVLVINFYFV